MSGIIYASATVTTTKGIRIQDHDATFPIGDKATRESDFATWASGLIAANSDCEIFIFAYTDRDIRYELTIPAGALMNPDKASLLFEMSFARKVT